MTYVIAQPCVDLKDRACVEECPVDCIYEGKRMLYIHPDECVDCGACEPVCPVEAIFYEDDTPEEWKGYYDANVQFFSEIGSPGGAAKMGVIDADHALVAAEVLEHIHADVDAIKELVRVLRPGGEVFPGLYAAGEVAGFGGGGMHGYRSLEGTFLGGCLFSGRVAGRAVAAAL